MSGQATNEERDNELLMTVHRILEAIHSGDVEAYRRLCAEDLSCYETDVAPYRIDSLGFHLDLIQAMASASAYDALIRYDVLHPRVQNYGDWGVVTYTRLMTWMRDGRATWTSFNESRIFRRDTAGWRMVHFHRSHAAT